MKLLVIALALLAPSLAVAGGTIDEVMGDTAVHHTPFEKLEHMFCKGEPARKSDFNYYDSSSPGVNRLGMTCSEWVKTDTKREDVKTSNVFPYVLVGKYVTGAATPGTGPLFLPRPERDEYREVILWGPVGIVDTQERVGTYALEHHIVLNQSDDDFSETQDSETTRVTWRMHDGLMVQRQAQFNDKGEVTQVQAYSYCWNTPPAPQPEPQPQPDPQPQPQPQQQHRSGD